MATCNRQTLLNQAVANGFRSLTVGDSNAVELQLLCNISAGGGGSSAALYEGSGNPNGVVSAALGSIYTDVTHSLIYYKTGGGTGNTGWVG